MPSGLFGYLYNVKLSDNGAQYDIWDPDDPDNTAEVTVDAKDFPAGVTAGDSRQVAELAFVQCIKVLDDKRDARLKKEATATFNAQQDQAAAERDARAEHFANSNDVQTEPDYVTKDGTKVFTAGPPGQNAGSGNQSKDSAASSGKK